jgi:hypothetical protein
LQIILKKERRAELTSLVVVSCSLTSHHLAYISRSNQVISMPFARNNYKRAIYDHSTDSYHVAGIEYSSYKVAQSNQWQCDRCTAAFSGMKRLKDHKSEMHSY